MTTEQNIKAILECFFSGYKDDIIDAAAKRILEIEPVRRGRWKRDSLLSTNGGSYEVWRCSECQNAFNWKMRYCGHCGAKMEVDDG